MIFTEEKEVEDYVVEFLSKDKASVKQIYASILKEEKISLRAVYKAVNKLISSGVLLKVGKYVYLNKEWAQKVSLEIGGQTGLPYLNEGEKVIYTMTSVSHLDAFWKTLLLSLDTKEGEPIFVYNLHDFWMYVSDREESEELFYKSFDEDGRYGFFAVGGNTELDLLFKRTYQSEYLKINLSRISSIKDTENITVWGDYIITVIVPAQVVAQIDALYQLGEISGVVEKIQNVLDEPHPYKVRVERNIKKAKKLRKIIGKDFYIPNEIRETYNI